MTITERRRLLAAGTTRPWRWAEDGYLAYGEPPVNWFRDPHNLLHWDHEGMGGTWLNETDHDLVVAAVNDYAVLLDIAEAARMLAAWDTGDWLIPSQFEKDRNRLRDALARL